MKMTAATDMVGARRRMVRYGTTSGFALSVAFFAPTVSAQEIVPSTKSPQPSALETAPSDQQPPAAADGSDIVVTANRGRAQSLQDIPMAVSAIQASTLATKGIDDLGEILKTVPSVNLVQIGPGQSQLTIRGIASEPFAITETGDRPLVSVYLDDVPISIQGANPDLRVFDLERVEVLRGPQGTLYGSGSMAGTIRYITKKPSTDKLALTAETVLSGTSRAGDPNWNVRGSANVPLTSDLALLLTAYTGRDAGFIDNIGIGKKDVNSARTTQGRGALRWTGVDNLTVDASLLYTRLRSNGFPVGYSGLPEYTYDGLTPEYYRDRMLIGNFTAAYDLGDVTMTSSSSYIDRKYSSQISGFIYEYLSDFLFGGVRQPSPGIVAQSIKTFTQEVRLVSDTNKPLSWSLGGFFESTRRNYEQNNPLSGVDVATGLRSVEDLGAPFKDDLFFGQKNIRERQFAVFAEGNYKITPKMDFTAGLRYFNFRERFSLLFAGIAGSAFEPNPVAGAQPTFLPLVQSGRPKASGVNPRFVLSYRPSADAMVFAEAARGFRYGSVNEPVASAFCDGQIGPTTVGTDNLWNYALGLKSQLADRKITFNATGFFVDWKKVQSRFDLSCGYYYRVNQGNIQSKGLELETSVRPFENFTLSLNGSFTDAKAKEDVLVPDGGIVGLDGDRAPLFPKWIGAFSTQYVVPVGDNRLTLTGDLQLRSGFGSRFRPDNPNYRETPSQSLINASATYELGTYEIGVFGTNLTNSSALSFVDSIRDRPGTVVAPYEARFYGRPRTIGVRLKAKL